MQTTDALNDDAIDFSNELFGDYDLDMYIIDEGIVHHLHTWPMINLNFTDALVSNI